MNTIPSRNPADSSGDMPGAMREILAKFLQSVDDMLPAKVIAFDRIKNRATVQPMIAMVATDGTPKPRHQVSIPVFNFGGGGCIMSFNLVSGDLGWIKATDRDMAEFLKFYSESSPATKRMHSFDTALFIPDVMTGYSIADEDTENAVLQTLDGSVRISIFSNKVKITAPVVEIDSAVRMGTGGAAIARVGDQVQIGTSTGTIITGSPNHTAT